MAILMWFSAMVYTATWTYETYAIMTRFNETPQTLPTLKMPPLSEGNQIYMSQKLVRPLPTVQSTYSLHSRITT